MDSLNYKQPQPKSTNAFPKPGTYTASELKPHGRSSPRQPTTGDHLLDAETTAIFKDDERVPLVL